MRQSDGGTARLLWCADTAACRRTLVVRRLSTRRAASRISACTAGLHPVRNRVANAMGEELGAASYAQPWLYISECVPYDDSPACRTVSMRTRCGGSYDDDADEGEELGPILSASEAPSIAPSTAPSVAPSGSNAANGPQPAKPPPEPGASACSSNGARHMPSGTWCYRPPCVLRRLRL